MDAIDELLTRGVDTIYPTRDALEKALRSGKKLRLYQGFDPTGIQLHIGHMTGLMKLRQFQNLGHHVIFLIGDGTGQAGDPSGKARTREKFLSLDELKHNAKEYVMQASKIVRFEGDNHAEIVYNSDWLNKLTLPDLLEIAGHFTLGQLEERDMYMERKKKNEEINFREFLYPLLQGYDSVAMKVDLELGGSDQTFNMLAGRKLEKEMIGKEKFVMTTPLLTDAQGRKIGKTEGNVIALTALPNDLYGMIMSLPDDAMGACFEFITDLPMDEVEKIKDAITRDDNPMAIKKKLAFTLTRMLNDEKSAENAQRYFEDTFQKRTVAKDIPSIEIESETTVSLLDFLLSHSLVESKSAARRLLKEGAIALDNKKITVSDDVTLKDGIVIKIGKHTFVRVKEKGKTT